MLQADCELCLCHHHAHGQLKGCSPSRGALWPVRHENSRRMQPAEPAKGCSGCQAPTCARPCVAGHPAARPGALPERVATAVEPVHGQEGQREHGDAAAALAAAAAAAARLGERGGDLGAAGVEGQRANARAPAFRAGARANGRQRGAVTRVQPHGAILPADD